MHEVATGTILTRLGITQEPQDREPYFRGWFYAVEPPTGQISYIIQWLPKDENEKFHKCAYVELPSLNSGIIAEGVPVRPGSERLTDVCSIEDMDRMMSEAVKRLKEVVASARTSNAEGSSVRDLPGTERVS